MNNVQSKVKTKVQKPLRKRRGRNLNKKKIQKQRRTLGRVPAENRDVEIDPRVVTAYQGIESTGTTKTVTVQVPIKAKTACCPLASWISAALSRGLQAIAGQKEYAYWAFSFASQILYNALIGKVQPAQKLPRWLGELCQAVGPKEVPFTLGSVNYSFSAVDALVVPASTQEVGYSAYGISWCCGAVSNLLTVNGFDTVQLVTPPLAEDGEKAFQVVSEFMASQCKDDPDLKVANEVVEYGKVGTYYANNVSAFSTISDTAGLGMYGMGGMATHAQLEVPIYNPLLSLVSAGEQTAGSGIPNRFYNHSVAVAGDAAFLGGAMFRLYPGLKMKSPKWPHFHFVDFLEFGEVMALWVQKIVQMKFDSFEENYPGEIDPAKYMCPITLQEMLILLRAVVMQAFKDTQHAVQYIYPFIPLSANDNVFVPYIAGAGLGTIGSSTMKLPTPLIENIRALVWRYRDEDNGRRRSWIPVLGQWYNDELVHDDYVWSADLPTGPINGKTFKSPAAMYSFKVKNKDGSFSDKLMAETPISLIDGSGTFGGNAVIVAINDEKRLGELSVFWNDWLPNVSAFSVPLGNLGTEKGISTLASVCLTRHVAEVSQARKQADSDCVDMRLREYKPLVKGIYSSIQSVSVSSFGKILAAPIEQVQNMWILPVNKIQYDNVNVNNSGSYIKYQLMAEEPHALVTTSGETGATLASLHLSYAAKMTRASLDLPSDWTSFFEAEAIKGRGGILSGLASGILGSFNPVLGSIAGSVGEALGF